MLMTFPQLFVVAPKIDRRNLKKVTIHAGESFFFDVKVIGEPAPTCNWLLNRKPVETRSTFRIENVPYNAKIFNDKAERKDHGTYILEAVNQYGRDEAEVEVEVLC